jgi:hypothetical protein
MLDAIHRCGIRDPDGGSLSWRGSMDSLTAVVTAIATGATLSLKPVVADAVKEAYLALKRLIATKYPAVSVALIEADPASKSRQIVLREDLQKANASADTAFISHARALIDAIRLHHPDMARVVGIEVADLTGAALRIDRVVAEGPAATGVSIARAELSGDVEITNVLATPRRDSGE